MPSNTSSAFRVIETGTNTLRAVARRSFSVSPVSKKTMYARARSPFSPLPGSPNDVAGFFGSRALSPTMTTTAQYSTAITKPNTHHEQFKRIFGLVVAALIGSSMVHQWVKLALPASKLSGKPAPDVAKDPGNPQRMVWDSTNYAGMGNGAEGRSAPHKSSITLPNGEVMYGYEKESSEGREGNLNELVFHLFGQLVLPGAHPRIKLIEHKISDEQSSYTLFIESIGENQSLLALCKELGKNTDVIPNINLVNLGCSIALAALIQSGDAFLKNFVVTNHANGQYAVYPIDFEVRDESGAIRFIDLTAQSTTAMKKMLTHGGILDYKTEFTFGENLRQANGAESTAGIGDGLCDHGRDVFAALITEGSKDIESDQILKMYQRIATLSDDDINELLNPISFVMTKKEKEKYHRDLMSIVHETQNYLKSVGKEPTTPDSDENTSSMQNK